MKESQALYEKINKAVGEAVKKLESDLSSPLVLITTKHQVSDKMRQHIEETLGEDKVDRYINVETYIIDGESFETDLDCELHYGHILNITVQVDAFRTFFLICLGKALRYGLRWDIECVNDLIPDLQAYMYRSAGRGELTEDVLHTYLTESLRLNNRDCESTCEISIFTTDIAGTTTPTECISMIVYSKIADNTYKKIQEKYNIKRCFTFWTYRDKRGDLCVTSLNTKRQYMSTIKYEPGSKTDIEPGVQAF